LDGEDYHTATAKLVAKQAWGIEPEAVEKKHRSAAKAINFGVLYGMGPYTLAGRIGCSPEEAEMTMKAIMGRFKKLDKFRRELLSYAQKNGVIWTDWDGKKFRRRPMWRVADNDPEARITAENGTLNTPIQGKASDFCLFSLVECVKWIIEEGLEKYVKLVLTVYDSIMFEVHKSMREEVLYTVPKIMLQWPSKGVPIVVDAEIGRSWGSLSPAGSFSNITDLMAVERAALRERVR
jgi:DNA polymerase-1